MFEPNPVRNVQMYANIKFFVAGSKTALKSLVSLNLNQNQNQDVQLELL